MKNLTGNYSGRPQEVVPYYFRYSLRSCSKIGKMGRLITTRRIDRRLLIGAIFIVPLFLRPRWEVIHPSDGIILRVFGAVLMTILLCRLTSWNPLKRPSTIELWADATAAAARGAPRPSHWAAGAVINLACTLVVCFLVAHVFVFELNHLCGSTAPEQKSAPILRTYGRDSSSSPRYGLVLESWRYDLDGIKVRVPKQIWLRAREDPPLKALIETRIGCLGIEYYDHRRIQVSE